MSTDVGPDLAGTAPSTRSTLIQRLTTPLAARWQRLPTAWRHAIVATLLLRVALGVLSLAFGGLLPGLTPVSVTAVPSADFAGWVGRSTGSQGIGLLGASLERFDALW
ncbi:MAG TPA: hypothetical protein VGA69_12765, partial [Nitriliruptorales bacterium]